LGAKAKAKTVNSPLIIAPPVLGYRHIIYSYGAFLWWIKCEQNRVILKSFSGSKRIVLIFISFLFFALE